MACKRSAQEMFKSEAHSLWRQSGYLPYDYVYENNDRARVPLRTVFRKQQGFWTLRFIFTPGKEMGRSGQQVRNVFMIRKVSLYAFCTFLLSLVLSGWDYNCTDEHKFTKHKSADCDTVERQVVPTCSGHNWVITKRVRQPNAAVIKTFRNARFSGL